MDCDEKGYQKAAETLAYSGLFDPFFLFLETYQEKISFVKVLESCIRKGTLTSKNLLKLIDYYLRSYEKNLYEKERLLKTAIEAHNFQLAEHLINLGFVLTSDHIANYIYQRRNFTDVDFLRYLLKHFDVIDSFLTRTAITDILIREDTKILHILKEYGYDFTVFAPEKYGFPDIRLDTLNFLIENGTDFSSKDWSNCFVASVRNYRYVTTKFRDYIDSIKTILDTGTISINDIDNDDDDDDDIIINIMRFRHVELSYPDEVNTPPQELSYPEMINIFPQELLDVFMMYELDVTGVHIILFDGDTPKLREELMEYNENDTIIVTRYYDDS